jgi:hypothetical protein
MDQVLVVLSIGSPSQMTSLAGAGSNYLPTSVRRPSLRHSRSTRQWLRHSTLLASWSPSEIKELSSLAIGLWPGIRSMAYKHSTQCVQLQSRMGEQSMASETCYVWEDSTRRKVVVLTYVDDCHVVGKTREGVQHIKAELQMCFKLRNLGPTNWFLGIDIQHNCSTCQITLSPTASILSTCSRTLVWRIAHQSRYL